MPHDLLITNGLVVDGTGAPGRHADVAIAAGKIAEIGKITDGARRIDAGSAGCVLAHRARFTGCNR